MSLPYGSDYIFKVGVRYLLLDGKLLLQFGDTTISYSSLPLGLQQAIQQAIEAVAMNPLVLGTATVALLLNSIYQGNKRKEAEDRAQAAQEREKKAQQRAEEANQREEEAQQREQEAREQLERGVEHVIPIPADEIRELRTRLGLGEEGDVVDNIAVIGRVSSGKTSFINSCRGLKRLPEGSQDADPRYRLGQVGNEETTQNRTEYRHKDYPTIVWWDMPGTGGKNQREWTYYNTFNLGLYNFLLILHDKPFSQTECNIVRLHQEQASQSPNPPHIFIIRTKSDESLRNIRKDTGLKGQELVAQFKQENTESVKSFLSKAGLDDSVAIYHISADALYKAATGNLTRRKITLIDELKLLRDLRIKVKWSSDNEARHMYDGSPPTSASEDETDSGSEETGDGGPSGESAMTGDDGLEEAISGVAEVKLTTDE